MARTSPTLVPSDENTSRPTRLWSGNAAGASDGLTAGGAPPGAGSVRGAGGASAGGAGVCWATARLHRPRTAKAHEVDRIGSLAMADAPTLYAVGRPKGQHQRGLRLFQTGSTE